MTEPHWRVAWLMKQLGGRENLPPKLTSPAEEEAPPSNKPTNYDSEEEERKNLPKIDTPAAVVEIQNARLQQLKDSATASAANPRASAASMSDFGFESVAFDERKGQPAPLGISFAPFAAVAKYCYTFVPPKWLQPFATEFFDNEKIYTRDWDLYYINSEYCGVLTFVPEYQLQALLASINTKFPEAKIKITDRNRESGLIIDFEDLPQHLRPRWLGRCSSRSKFRAWTDQLQMEPASTIPTGDRSVEAFKAKMDLAAQSAKSKKKAQKAKTFQHVIVQRQDMVRQTLRAQRYLGLLPESDDSLMPDIASLTMASAIDANVPAPHPFDSEPIFIAIDLEAWEMAPRMITEIGIATLDTRDLKGIPPGDVAQNWHQFIRGRHFLVKEYTGYVNHQFVQGCPNSFEFGESEVISKDHIPSYLTSCFHQPFSHPNPPEDVSEEPRNIVVVGHDLAQDINYCHQIGFSVLNRSSIIDTADTVSLYRAFTKDPNARSLGTILYDFDLTGWHLHNAGNDAAYTLQAMLAICVRSAMGRTSVEEERIKTEELEKKKVDEKVEEAKVRVKEDMTGWDSSDGDDGGVALPPNEKDFELGAQRGVGGGGRGGRGGRGGYGGRGGGGGGLYTSGGAPLDV
ncbi:unnamed protein product [Zymoseptoria tritici ST99CH_3D1]|nr:unnamed protein product [Zymoseptoria tritici ST99CH_3D1]